MGRTISTEDAFVIAGQSNAAGQATNNQTYTGNRQARMFGNDYVIKPLTDPTDDNTNQVDTVSSNSAGGSAWPLVASDIDANTDRWSLWIPCALGGTAVSEWEPGANHFNRSTLYGSMAYRARCAGRLRAVFWYQGTRDIKNGTTQAAYEASLTSFVQAVDTDLGVPVLVGRSHQWSDGTFSASAHSDVVAAQSNVISSEPNALAGPDMSAYNTGGVHYTSDEQIGDFADAWWTSIQAAFY